MEEKRPERFERVPEPVTYPGALVPEAPAAFAIALPQAEKEGPLFVSFARFNEIKADVAFLRDAVTSLKSLLEDMQQNSGQASTLLSETSTKTEDVEERAEKLSQMWLKRRG